MIKERPIKKAPEPEIVEKPAKLLDYKYWVWFVLIILKCLAVTNLTGFKVIDYAMAGTLLVFMVINITKPKEMIFLLMAAYFTNIRDWFTTFALVGGEGSRILLMDVLILMIMALSFLKILQDRKFNPFWLQGLLYFLMVFWIFNFVQGILGGGGAGYAIGEARMYFGSFIMIIIINLFDGDPMQNFRKVVKIISLCGLNIFIFVILMSIFGTGEGGEGDRLNPGNSEAEVMVFALLAVILDFIFKKDYSVLKISKPLQIGIFLGLIFICGVRAMLGVSLILIAYFIFVSNKISLGRKVGIVVGMIAIGAVALVTPVGQKVFESQAKYIAIMQGKGKSTDDTSAAWRARMWAIFMDHVLKDNTRIFLGRPFGEEKIDIRALKWESEELKGGTKVDNSLAHNDYVSMVMTNGFVFVGLFILVILMYSLRAIIMSRKYNDDLGYFLLFFGWVLLMQFIQSGTNAEIKHYGFSISLWWHIGLLAVLYRHIKLLKRNEKSQNIHRHTVV